MGLFVPDQIFSAVSHITLEYLRGRGITALLLDADNTLSAHGSQQPAPGVVDWVTEMKAGGIALCIVSNNSRERCAPFAAQLGIPFEPNGAKPLPGGFLRGLQKLGAGKGAAAVVGDQVFTDVLGARLAGLAMLMVLPVAEETLATIRFKRKLEKPLLRAYYGRGGTVI